MGVVVVGSINMDLVVRVPQLPRVGETLIGHDFMTVPGGKGANQAVAAARLGVPTQLIGRVGKDAFGETLLATLKESGVGCDRVTLDDSTASGIALIEVDGQGQNHIVVVPGANGQLQAEQVMAAIAVMAAAQVLLLQLEIPLPTVLAAAQLAHQQGVRVVLDPAPAQGLPPALYPLVDILTPNQAEAEQLTGMSIRSSQDAIAAGQCLCEKGVKTVIVTLGAQGVVVISDGFVSEIPGFTVDVVDTVAAGDTFNGGLAAALSQGYDIDQSIIRGMAAAALSVMHTGAQQSIPNSQALEGFLAQNYKN